VTTRLVRERHEVVAHGEVGIRFGIGFLFSRVGAQNRATLSYDPFCGTRNLSKKMTPVRLFPPFGLGERSQHKFGPS
jgi:hypothetical protein